MGKSLERCVLKHIYNYVIENNLVTPFQSGFTQCDSTTNQLIFIILSLKQVVDSRNEIKVVFCDIRKAFDRVCHRGHLYKLSPAGDLLRWVSSSNA